MKIEIKINSIIDALICELDEIQTFYQKVPRGSFIDGNKGYSALYERKELALKKIGIVVDVLGVPASVVWETVLVARRWYNRTKWQFCLSEDDAGRLWELGVKNCGKNRNFFN